METMTEENEKTNFTEAEIRKYLLGNLGDKREEMEMRLLSDDEFFQRASLSESELIDDYVAGKLSVAEKNDFERFFLVTEERRKNLKFTEALRKQINKENADSVVRQDAEKKSWLAALSEIFGVRAPVLAFGALALFLFFSFGIWFFLKPITLPENREVARRDDFPKASPSVQPQISPEPQVSPAAQPVVSPNFSPPTNSPNRNAGGNPKPNQNAAPPPTPTVLATVVLKAGALRDGGELARLRLPADKNGLINLQLEIEPSEAKRYQAEIVTAENRPVFTRSFSTKPNAARLSFIVPVKQLQAGDYQIKLTTTADGETISAGRYALRVLPN